MISSIWELSGESRGGDERRDEQFVKMVCSAFDEIQKMSNSKAANML